MDFCGLLVVVVVVVSCVCSAAMVVVSVDLWWFLHRKNERERINKNKEMVNKKLKKKI